MTNSTTQTPDFSRIDTDTLKEFEEFLRHREAITMEENDKKRIAKKEAKRQEKINRRAQAVIYEGAPSVVIGSLGYALGGMIVWFLLCILISTWFPAMIFLSPVAALLGLMQGLGMAREKRAAVDYAESILYGQSDK